MNFGQNANIAVIIVNWNSGRFLRSCLTALESQTLLPDQVIIADNASTDNSLPMTHEYQLPIKILRLSENTGFSYANNKAVESLDDTIEWIVLLNADTEPDPGWLANLVEGAHKHPNFDFFASTLLSMEEPSLYDGTGDRLFYSGLAKRHRYREGVKADLGSDEVFAPCAAAAMYRASAFRAVGGFDDSYFCYFEDVDLAFRLRLKGCKCLWVSNATVLHYGGGLTEHVSDTPVYYGHRNMVWNYFKNMPLPLLLGLLPFHIVANLATLLYYSFKGKRQTIFKAKKDAILGLPAIWAQRKDTQAKRISSWRVLQQLTPKLW
ncbi:MAG: glycosyltransferase family 2 protein [Pseudomonadales bacterium]